MAETRLECLVRPGDLKTIAFPKNEKIEKDFKKAIQKSGLPLHAGCFKGSGNEISKPLR